MINYTIFVVDDEPSIREGVASELEDDYVVFSYETAEDALDVFKENPADLILLDIELPGIKGTDALLEFKKIKSDVLVIMITAYEDIKLVITSMRNGAYDYIVKPIHMEALEITITNALETIRLRKEIAALQEKQIRENLPCFIGESRAIHDILEYIDMVAQSPDTPILILGDTGTGKELIAARVHHKSPNFKGPLLTVNCAAIPKELLESELFGYEKGAFSGASAAGKKGLIEAAHNGTLFLDEVGDLDLSAQAKLLRFMESSEFYKVGSTEKHTIQTRIVSATNKDLDKMIISNEFRKDLYFRLGVVKIKVPSLNERHEDTILLARYFLQVYNEKFGKSLTGISDRATELLKLYIWSGNVRELKNMMERAVLTARGAELTAKDLGLENIDRGRVMQDMDDKRFPPLPPTGIDIMELRLSMDRFYFNQAMQMAKGNETRAAKLLNLKHHTFRYQLKKLTEE